MKKHKSFKRPHYVDEEQKIVYVQVNSWNNAVSGSLHARKYFGLDYKVKLVSQKILDEIIHNEQH